MSGFASAWRGEMRLWKVYWIYGIVYPFLLYIGAALIVVIKAIIDHKALDIGAVMGSMSIVSWIGFAYTLWWAIAVFKCSDNTDSSLWKYLAILFSILHILYALNTALSAMNPRQAVAMQKCIGIMEEYARKLHTEPATYISNNRAYLLKCTSYYSTQQTPQAR